MDGPIPHGKVEASFVGQKITVTTVAGKTITGYILAVDLKEHTNTVVISKEREGMGV